MNNPTELLPCPFCGSAGLLRGRLEDARRKDSKTLHRVICSGTFSTTGCGTRAETKSFYSAGEATAAWNTRANQSELVALRAVLTDLVGEELSGESHPRVRDDDPVHSFCVTFGMLRRARAALKLSELTKESV